MTSFQHVPQTVLSIDWDYFTGDCSTSKCCQICPWTCLDNHPGAPERPDEPRWRQKVRSKNTKVFRKGTAVPSIKWVDEILESDPLQFEMVMDLLPEVKELVVTDCHGSLYRLLKNGSWILNIDAHTDMGEGAEFLHCGNWATRAEQNKDCKVFNVNGTNPCFEQALSDWSFDIDEIDLLFLCLSRPYTPPVLDHHFFQAIRDLEEVTSCKATFKGKGSQKLRRRFENGTGTMVPMA